MIINGISLMGMILGALLFVHSVVRDNKNNVARCVRCGEKDPFLMLLFKSKTLRLCKECYDEEIDQDLAG